MTIVVALSGTKVSVVASDGRRFESNGEVRDDYSKVYRLKNGYLCCISGLLELRGTPTHEWLDHQGFGQKTSFEAFVERLAPKLVDALDHPSVGFGFRVLDLIFVAPPWPGQRNIRSIMIRPNLETMKLNTKLAAFVDWSTAGDDKATAVVIERLNAQWGDWRNCSKLGLLAIARNLIAQATLSAGPHPHNPGVCSCGGAPHVAWL